MNPSMYELLTLGGSGGLLRRGDALSERYRELLPLPQLSSATKASSTSSR